MLKKGSPIKIDYISMKPVAKILFYQKVVMPSISKPMKNAMIIHRVYNPLLKARRKRS